MGTIYLRATDEVYDKFWAYVLAVQTEIGGYGFATIDNGKLIWHDIFLVDQEVSSGSVDFSDKGMAQAIERAALSGFHQDPNGVWVWWHSHANFSTFWSSTDEGGVKALRDGGVPYLISVVGNHKMESKVRIDVFNVPLIGQAEHHDMELRRLEPNGSTIDVDSEIKEFVTEKATKPWASSGKRSTSTSWHGADRPQLPPGTRRSDPGSKVEESLGYAEYTRDETEGGSWISATEPGFDVDDDGAVFNWKDVIEYISDEEEAKEWRDQGFDVIKAHGEFFLLQTYDAPDKEAVDHYEEVMEEGSEDPDFSAMDKLESRVNGDSQPPIMEAHAR